jgi:DNA-binding CsgD family transcriptional regulator
MISWRRFVDEKPATARILSVIGTDGGFSVYASNRGEKYVGLQKILKLHNPDVPIDVQEFAFALVVPQEEYRSARFEKRMAVIGIFSMILIIGAFVSYLVNKWFVGPMMSIIDATREDIKEETGGSPGTTDIEDLEDLLASIRERAEDKPQPETERTDAAGKARREPSLPDAGDKSEFAEKVKTLSAAEKKVFDLYIEGCTGPEISKTLIISPNTVKTHTRNILAKMQAVSKRELISANIKMLRDEHSEERK